MAQGKCWKWNAKRKRFIYDYKSKRLGIPRTRAAFRSNDEAEYFHSQVLRQYLGLLDKRTEQNAPERLFGEALSEYLETISQKLLSHGDNLSNAAALRWPYQYRGKFYRLEELPLNDSDTGILAGLEHWLADQTEVVKRAYLNKELYQLRDEDGKPTWYHQPNPADTRTPQPRQPVTGSKLVSQLDQLAGRGPFSADTLRLRQQLVAAVLKAAYNKFRWTQVNLADFIERIEGHEGHKRKLDTDQLHQLIEQARQNYGEMFALLIMGAVRIGWRRANLIGLTWNRVIWPANGEPGYLFIPRTKQATFNPLDKTLRRERTKNGDELITVMDERTEQLLRRLYDLRHPDSDVVFHDGSGHYWGECRKPWHQVKELAGIDPDFRWHDLRHTWASDLVNAGIDSQTIMEQQGWKSHKMVERYGHKDLATRLKAMRLAQ